MKRIVALAALLGACAGLPPPPSMEDYPLAPLWRSMPATDLAANRLEMLVQRGKRFCTEDGAWCADATGELTSTRAGASATIGATGDEETQRVWEFAIRRNNGHVMLGIVSQTSDMYAGGGAWARVLTLYDVAPGANEATPVVSLPYYGTAAIRACFDQEDRRARRSACLDQYSFAGRISLDTANEEPWPQLIFTTEAQTYPRPRSRGEDSTLAPPLRREDLAWARDERCSYRRVLTYSEGAGGYAPDAPLPDCPDYFPQ